ncbi:unnamed protein product [Linum trigynum]|uniref:Uncharacterized protein n=1 Tax=Linum trigynum TaxID=586398 RepID=A0AAV2CE16_9ROSI
MSPSPPTPASSSPTPKTKPSASRTSPRDTPSPDLPHRPHKLRPLCQFQPWEQHDRLWLFRRDCQDLGLHEPQVLEVQLWMAYFEWQASCGYEGFQQPWGLIGP